MTYLTKALLMLLDVVFLTYILVVMLRFLLQWVRADFRNPIYRFIITVTNPPLRPMRRFIPGLAGMDMSSVILMFALQALSLWLSHLILGVPSKPAAVLVLTVGELLQLAYYIYLFAILIQVIFSWVNPGNYNPVIELFNDLTRPLLGPIRRRVPLIGGLDLSPLLLLLALQLGSILLIAPVLDYGTRLLLAR